MIEKHQHFDDAGPDWDRLAGSLEGLAADRVTEFDVVRLRRSVGRALPSVARTHRWARLAASAAAIVVGAVSLYSAIDRHDPLTVAALPAQDRLAVLGTTTGAVGAVGAAAAVSVKMAAEADGSVIFQFSDPTKSHRIIKSTDPVTSNDDTVKIAKGRQFVDRNEQPRPGQVVFYRID